MVLVAALTCAPGDQHLTLAGVLLDLPLSPSCSGMLPLGCEHGVEAQPGAASSGTQPLVVALFDVSLEPSTASEGASAAVGGGTFGVGAAVVVEQSGVEGECCCGRRRSNPPALCKT